MKNINKNHTIAYWIITYISIVLNIGAIMPKEPTRIYLDGAPIEGNSVNEKYQTIISRLSNIAKSLPAAPKPTKSNMKQAKRLLALYIVNVASEVGGTMRDTFNADSRVKELYLDKILFHELLISNDPEFENFLKENMIDKDMEYVMKLGIDGKNTNNLRNNYIYPAYFLVEDRKFRSFNRQDFVTVLKSNFSTADFNKSMQSGKWQKGKQNYGFEIDETYKKWKQKK